MDDLRTRIAAAVGDYMQRWGIRCECGADHAHHFGLADAVIRELGAIPDRSFTDDQGRTWEWCGGQPRTWAWRITANSPVEVDVKCAVCKRTYSVRADAPGWSAVWTCCIGCQVNEGSDQRMAERLEKNDDE